MKKDGTLKSVVGVCVVILVLVFVLGHPEMAFAAALTVNSIADTTGNDGECTLREAIINANSDGNIWADCPGGVYGVDTIQFSLSYPATISLTTPLPILNDAEELTIDGPGAADLILLGQLGVRIFEIAPGASARISGVRLEEGAMNPGNGGGILNYGHLEIIDSVLSNNGTGDDGGGLYNAAGGVVEITGSTFDSNYAPFGDGGGIYNAGMMAIANSTFSEDMVTHIFGHIGGGIYNGGSLTLRNATLSNNSPENLFNAPGAALDFANSILSDSSDDCRNAGSITGNVHNLIEHEADAAFTCTGADTMYGFDPQLVAPPADNGGPTPTLALGLDSPAINAGDNGVCAGGLVGNVDQRGVARPQYGQCDIGAFEIDTLVFSTTVDITGDTYDGLCVVGACSLRDAVASAASGGTVDFNLSYPATIMLTSQITIGKDLTLSGPGAANLTVSGGTSVRIFEVASGASVVMDGLRLADGRAVSANGGGVLNNGDVEIRDSIFSGNYGDANGGGLYNAATGTAVITGSTFNANTALIGEGGGIYNLGMMTVANSTFWNNIGLFAPHAGGIYNGGTLFLRNSTLSNNLTKNLYNTGTLDFANTILADSDNDCDNTGTITGNTRNLIEYEASPARSCVGADTIYGSDPQLAVPPTDNGGPTPTLALQTGSPAIGAGDNGICAAAPVGGVDQRGIGRPQFLLCDIGAFEAENHPPTDMSLSSTTISENGPSGTLVGTLTTTDPDAGDTHTYNLQSGVSGCDDSGNGFFQIPGGTDQLQSAAVFDYETPPTSFNVCIRTTDSGGLTYDEQFTITVADLDDAAPSLTAFLRNAPAASPTNADVLVFRSTFDEDVHNVDAADFAVDGATTATVTGVSVVDASTYDITVSGGDLASFNGDVGLNLGVSQNIEDLAGNPLPAGEPATDEVYTVDNDAPTVQITSAAGDPTNTSPIPVTITFSTPVTGFDIGDLTVGNGAAGTFAGTGAVYTADITPAANGLVTVDVAAGAAVDGAGNGNTAATQFAITYDTSHPTVVYGANTVPADNSVLPAGPMQVFLEFSKDVVADGSADAANNPANYVLVEDGANNVFDTTGCAAVDPVNDTVIPVDAVLYDNNSGLGPFLATLDINGGTALGPGRYRLFVCGTTSIYDPAGNRLNDGADSLLTFTVSVPASVPETGFAPDRVTVLPPQTIAYTKLGDLWLEVPQLGVRAEIVGVPLVDGEWDVTWLGANAGWLEGTAFPTWAGNSVITAHVWDAYNRPGLFYGLDSLGWGDAVIVHAWGGKYTYEVRQVLQVRAADTAAMLKHEELPWMTLVTCKGYNAAADAYRYRLLVRAVLIEVR